MNFESDDEIPGSSQKAVERGERGLLKDFIPVLVFNQRTLERMKKMEGLRRRGVELFIIVSSVTMLQKERLI